MSNVTLRIGGRDYTVACAEGEEAHIAGLGRLIETKIASMEGAASQTEVRTLLFASLLLADEVHEARSKSAATPADASPFSVDRLEAIATRMENLASALEG